MTYDQIIQMEIDAVLAGLLKAEDEAIKALA